MARPKKTIDLEELEKLGGLLCTYDEAAAWFKVSRATFYRRMQDADALQAWERGQGVGKISLRRKQMRLAEKNAAMAIFLGKNVLGQRDEIRTELTGANGGPVEITESPRDILASRIARLTSRIPANEDSERPDRSTG